MNSGEKIGKNAGESVGKNIAKGAGKHAGTSTGVERRTGAIAEMNPRRRGGELRVLIDHSPDPIFAYDREGRRIYVNRRALELAGYKNGTDDSALIGALPTDGRVINESGADTVMQAIRRVVQSGKPDECEVSLRSPGGRLSVFQNRFQPEFDSNGQVVSVVSVWRDITALKRAERSLRQSRDLLRALAVHHESRHEDERREIARKIHEDLAQNLATVRIGLAAVKGSAEGLAMMQQAIDRSMGLMRDMVAALRPTVLDHQIGLALRWLSEDFRKTVGLQFELDLDDRIGLDGATTTFLFRAAQEILVNVVLHAAAHTVHVSLALGDTACHLVIRDDGRGFDPSALVPGRAFGLLYLTEQAEARGGVMNIVSAPGQGTTVEIRVPVPCPKAIGTV